MESLLFYLSARISPRRRIVAYPTLTILGTIKKKKRKKRAFLPGRRLEEDRSFSISKISSNFQLVTI